MRTNANMKKILALGSAPMVLSSLPSAHDNGGLTPFMGALYNDLNVISRELVGYIPSVSRNTSAERAGVGQSVSYNRSNPAVATDIVPSMNKPEPADRDTGMGQITITKSKKHDFKFTGEEQHALANGIGVGTIINDEFAEGVRALVNEIEQDLADETVGKASRATGTAGNTPYTTGVGDSAQAVKILKDNGQFVQNGVCQVLDTSSGAAFQTNTQLTRVDEAGDQMTLRDGAFGRLHGSYIKETGANVEHTSSNTSVNTDGSAYPVGSTVITMAAGGHAPGDVISFAGDPNQYVVGLAAGAAITINAPGLRVAIPAVATAVTTAGDYSANTVFAKSAVHLVTRAPAISSFGGQDMDEAVDSELIVDPRSGLVFEVRLYKGYRMMAAEVAISWGVHASKSEGIGLVLG